MDSMVNVAPLAGAWIEIKVKVADTLMDGVSLPSRERGLKSTGI